MSGKPRDDEVLPVDWERLARAELHPLRIDIIEILRLDGGRTLSASEMALELHLPLSNVDYHARLLARSGFLVAIAHRRSRGATEHFYALDNHDGADLFQRPPFTA